MSNRDFLEEDYEDRHLDEVDREQSWDFASRPNNHVREDGFGNHPHVKEVRLSKSGHGAYMDELLKRNHPHSKEISKSGHGAYMEEFDPSPEQGSGGFDPLFRPSKKDPRHLGSYKERSTVLRQQGESPNGASKYSGTEKKKFFELSSHGKHSTGIEWGSWGPEPTLESEFGNNQLDGLKDKGSKDYDYFDAGSGYNVHQVQPKDPGEDFGNEIYYEKEQRFNERGARDEQRGARDENIVPHFDFDDFHRSAGSWY